MTAKLGSDFLELKDLKEKKKKKIRNLFVYTVTVMFRGKQLPFTMVVFMSLSGRVSGHRLQPRVAASSPQGEHGEGGGGEDSWPSTALTNPLN